MSRIAEERIAYARECFRVGLISERTLETVVARLMAEPEYNPVLELPPPWTYEHEIELERQALRRDRGGRLRRVLRFGRGTAG